MSTAIRRGGSASAFTFSGAIADPRDEAFQDLLAQRRFRTIENAASEEVSVGWCTPADPSGDTFAFEDMDGGPATWLRVRVDQKKLPAEWLAVHRDAAERARGKRLTARERREFKDDLVEKLLPRVLPKVAFIDALLFRDRGLVILLAGGTSARDTFAHLWQETFGVPLDALTPKALACAAADKAEPTRWPNGGAGGDDGADTSGFLGEEFLLWLWHQWETKGGEFTLPGNRFVGIAIDDLIVFAPKSGDEHEQTIRHGLPTRAPEARTALQEGHRLAKARLLVAEGARQWTVTLEGCSLACGAVKLPEDADECETTEDRTADRVSNWLALQQIIEQLFAQFLRVRLSEGWKQEAAAMAGWMAS